MAKSKTVRTLTEAEIEKMREAAKAEAERNEQLKQRADSGKDSGTERTDVIVVSGNGLRGATWAGDTVDTIARAWKDANPNDKRSFMQVRDWIIRENRLKTVNGQNCEGDLSRVPNIVLGQELKLPEGKEITNLNWKYACPLPTPPLPDEPAAPPPPAIEIPAAPKNLAPEYYSFQATTQGDNNNGLINAWEQLAATGVEPFSNFYIRPDIAAVEGSKKTSRTGMNNEYMNQGPRKDDTYLSSSDNGSPKLTEERHTIQGHFYAGNLLVGKDRKPDPEAQARFLAGEGFTGHTGKDFVPARVGIIIPFGGTREPRGDMNIGQTSTGVSGAIMPTYTLSMEDFVNRDIWFSNNAAQTSAPIGTYDRALAYGDYYVTSKEFKAKSQSLISRLEGGDTTITRAEVQDVLNTGNYAQMNLLVRDSGLQHPMQAVLKDIHGKFENYAFAATDQSPPLVLRNGASPDIFNTPVAELGGYRLKVASAERFGELQDKWGSFLVDKGTRFDGFKGIEGQPLVGAYRVIHQRPTAVGQYIAENRANLTRDSRELAQQKTTAALTAVLGTTEAPNGAGASALWAQAAERPEIATAMVNTLSQAYNNPQLFGFTDRRQVEELVSNLTGQPVEREREKAGKGGDKYRNATDQALGDSEGRIAFPTAELGGYVKTITTLFGNKEGRMIDPQDLARLAATRVPNDPALQAATTRLFTTAPLAAQVGLLQTIAADPRVDQNFGPGKSMRDLAAASGASIDRDSAFFQGAVGAEVYSRPGFADVEVSARGYMQDWMATYAGRINGGTDPVVRSNVDMSATEAALASGDRAAAFRELVSGEQAKKSGSGQLVVESMRFNPMLSANLVTATMLRDPQAFNESITRLRALDDQYKGGKFPLIGDVFGLLDADKFGPAAGALEKSQKKMAKIDAGTLEAAQAGDKKALKQVREAMEPWNKFTADMLSDPQGKGGHMRYAAHQYLWDTIAHDPRAQAAMIDTISAEPQLREAAIETLQLTPMQTVDMREEQFIGKQKTEKKGQVKHVIPTPVTGPAIQAASGMYVDFVPEKPGSKKVKAVVDAAALVAPSTASVAASLASAPNSAAAAVVKDGSLNVGTAPGSLLDGKGNPLPAVNADGFIVVAGADGVQTVLKDAKGAPVPGVDNNGNRVAGLGADGLPVLAYDANGKAIPAASNPPVVIANTAGAAAGDAKAVSASNDVAAGSAIPGSGPAGSAMPGSGPAGSAIPGSGPAGSAIPGSGPAGSAIPGSGPAGSAIPGSGPAGSAIPGAMPAGSTLVTAGVTAGNVVNAASGALPPGIVAGTTVIPGGWGLPPEPFILPWLKGKKKDDPIPEGPNPCPGCPEQPIPLPDPIDPRNITAPVTPAPPPVIPGPGRS